MHKNRLIISLCFLSLFLTLTGCATSAPATESADKTPEQAAKLQGEQILQGVMDKDAETIADLFCPYAKKYYPNLEEDIADWIELIDGEILSYDTPECTVGGVTGTAADEVVKQSVNGRINKIKTSSGKTYLIGYGGYGVYKEHPDYAGITNVTIFVKDAQGAENQGYLEGEKYVIYAHLPYHKSAERMSYEGKKRT